MVPSILRRSCRPSRVRVHIEKDVSDSDRYGRLLRYVYLEDGRMVNELLVLEGYAQTSRYPPDVKYQDGFVVLDVRQVRG
jgi:micrococcal nuclease